ncbi:type IIG restriction enzyme/methyltransferase [Marinirhabdus gelatinilytica]|uniref:site-specific DNA-methyltransferase (adenine-specific) n=1 Tax=Marinirhabdus gelatinilytica TaxID=1703343 RepID=A0A370QH10_9FLAO|nr:TaqI-like C-terminal specificity domain-containing protein [Marinirhabdus gelatinilytica]RDK87380.1 type II restriction/modification system DNA methylase subunit YeeA [Marinirhabdus gelatinilytica]
MNKTNTRKALNPAYRKHKPLRKDVNKFVEELKQCLQEVKHSDDNGESEEHIKSHFIQFFKNTFYAENYINTKERIDLAIYTGKTAKSDVSVIIEAKKPSNKSEFLTETNINRKALQELLLYYLRERLDNENNNIKHLVATNGYEWYLFKAEDFYNYFYKNKALLKEYKAFRDGLKDTSKNELFYNEIAKKYIAEVEQDLPFVHLDFSKTNFDKLSDAHLNTLFKIFSNVHLLGHSFGNDSNQLNKAFYNELLHIIGLEEVKDKGKKVISRKSEKNRDYASLLESTIFHLEDRDYLHKIKSIENNSEKAFNAGLELCLTWVNRILFLKLLESQLLTYHDKNPIYKFLNSKFINGYDDLNDLFFSALAKIEEDRHPRFKDKYQYIPYLNSSLFERSILEDEAFEISALNNDDITIYSGTVLKDINGKKQKGKLKTLDYLFQFLDAYDFATDGNEGIEDAQETKSLINASVLGLIFEKINGYKEGSFYTPAYITMYMCKETLRRAVVQKFKEQENDQIETFEDLQSYCQRYFKIDDLKRFNTIVNSLRICDPAVGSGHFLVSALNELIVIKNELGILVDAKGLPLRCDIEIVNDELYVIDDKGLLFEYNPTEKESTRIQHTLFHEKQTLIENCLFGVDINPNSVKICRLRLWIELLKNAYYTKANRLQTLPNIDINIKCGNSLISRFSLDDDLKDAFRNKKNPKLKYTFTDYKNAVAEYKDTNKKERKREVLEIIEEVKDNFKSTLDNKFINKFINAQKEYNLKEEQINNLKKFGEKISKAEKERLLNLKSKVEEAYLEQQEIVNNAIYHNAFEWRFEFPEVLSEDGGYIGFDAIIGNPPYIKERDAKDIFAPIRKSPKWQEYLQGKMDLWYFFLHQAFNIADKNAYISYITNSYWVKSDGSKNLINRIFNEKTLNEIIYFDDYPIFEEVSGKHMIHSYFNSLITNDYEVKLVLVDTKDFSKDINKETVLHYNNKEILNNDSINLDVSSSTLFNDCIELGELYNTSVGIQESSDKVASKNIPTELEYKFKGGEGVFVINKNEVENLELNEEEKKILKPYLNTHNVVKYGINFSDEYLIFSDKKIREQIKENIYPNLKKHLDNVTHFVTSSNAPYGLHRDRSSKVNPFDIPKLICPGMFKFPHFTYDDKQYYVGFSFSVIWQKNKDYDLKYLLGIMNSKLGEYWFNTNGKKRGVGVDIGVKVFRQFPVKKASLQEQETIINLVDKVLSIKIENPNIDTKSFENEIDQMVYKLYGLTAEEISIVENN